MRCRRINRFWVAFTYASREYIVCLILDPRRVRPGCEARTQEGGRGARRCASCASVGCPLGARGGAEVALSLGAFYGDLAPCGAYKVAARLRSYPAGPV